MIRLLGNYGGHVAGKAIMRMIGLDCGPVRQPLDNITAAQFAGLQRDLEGIGLFDAIKPGSGH